MDQPLVKNIRNTLKRTFTLYDFLFSPPDTEARGRVLPLPMSMTAMPMSLSSVGRMFLSVLILPSVFVSPLVTGFLEIRGNLVPRTRCVSWTPARSCRHAYPRLYLFPKNNNNSNKDDNGVDRGWFNLLETSTSGSFSLMPRQGQIVGTAKEGLKFVWRRMMAELAPQDRTGAYKRPTYSFLSSSSSKEKIDVERESGRYHLYVGNPCPWCHRTTLALCIRGLWGTGVVGVTRLLDDPVKASRGGWIFGNDDPDPLFGASDLRELYDQLSPGFQGRCTAPLLVDKTRRQIVSNESSDIVRLLMTTTPSAEGEELTTTETLARIDEVNEWTYRLLNDGVYRCGFATTQAAYDRASADVREGLQRANELLASQPYLVGDRFTEADLRLLPTALRFDGVYGPLFRAGGAHVRIRDYPHLHAWLKRCWQWEWHGDDDDDSSSTSVRVSIRDTIDLPDATASYYRQLFPLNPGGILPTPVTAVDLGLEP